MMSLWAWIKALFVHENPPAPVIPLPTPALPSPVQPQPSSTDYRVRGLDVSHWQDKLGSADWEKLFGQGYRFSYAKCNDGHAGPDKLYQKHTELARAAGFLVGGYHYFRFDYDPKKQAQDFYNACMHRVGDLPPVLDVEWDKYTNNPKYGSGGRMDDAGASLVHECLLEIERLFGVQPILYTNAYFWPSHVSNPDRFYRYLAWIPSYANSLKPSGDKVAIPYPWKQWNIWQDGDNLSCGATTKIDTNVFRGSMEDLKALCNKP